MSTTTYERGDILLLNVPLGENLEMRVRPVMAMHDCSKLDPHIAIVPITPDPMVGCNALLIPLGSFESARMGLVTNAYLNTVEEVLVDRHFVVESIGRCPYRTLNQFLKMYRSGLGFAGSQTASITPSCPQTAPRGQLSSRIV